MGNNLDKKEKIIQGAGKLFSEFGWDKTTMKEIAEMANIGKATLYYYFDDKMEIYQAAVKNKTEQIKQEIEKAIQEAEDYKSKLIAYVTTRLENIQQICNYYGQVRVRESIYKNYPVIEELRQEFDDFEKNLIQNLLSRGVAEGELVIDDIDLATRAFYAGVRGSEYQVFHQEAIENIEQDVETLMNMIFQGIEKN